MKNIIGVTLSTLAFLSFANASGPTSDFQIKKGSSNSYNLFENTCEDLDSVRGFASVQRCDISSSTSRGEILYAVPNNRDRILYYNDLVQAYPNIKNVLLHLRDGAWTREFKVNQSMTGRNLYIQRDANTGTDIVIGEIRFELPRGNFKLNKYGENAPRLY